jgi:hypothetical protein
LNELYQRQKASDMLESIMDTFVLIEYSWRMFCTFYPEVSNQVYGQTTIANIVEQYKQQSWQVQQIILELRKRGV